jgi:hypothetical protein
MGYVGLIQRLVHDALTPGKFLGDIPVQFTYYSGDDGDLVSYIPTIQIVTRNETVGFPVYGVFANATERQIDNVNVLKNDRFFYLSNLNLVEAGITTTRIKPNDRINQDGVFYTIIRADVDPTYSLWTLQGRQP